MLKAILFENHVKVDFSQVLEKGELVKRVTELIKEERKRLERQAREEEAEAAAAAGETIPTPPAGDNGNLAPDPVEAMRTSAELKRPVTGPPSSVERDGLCVVCQDNEAQLAVVDCGHLSMCQDCSKLVMSTSRQCPICRERIVTEQRLIRIFRT